MKFFIPLILTLSTLLGDPLEALRRDYDKSPLKSFQEEYHSALGERDLLYKEALTESFTPDFVIRFQMEDLEETVARAETELTLDEELRRRISNLNESTKFQRGIEVEELLREALDRYNKNELLIREYQAESEVLAPLHELARDHKRMELYATKLEESLGLKSWQKDRFRCGMTARAILYHFLQERDFSEIKALMRAPIYTMEALKNHLELAESHTEVRWIYAIDSVRLDHVFLILQVEDGSYRMVQSFVNHYSLAAELTNLPALSYQDVQEIINKIEMLDQASDWNEELDTLYEELFKAPAPSYITEEFSQGKADFKFVAIPLYTNPIK